MTVGVIGLGYVGLPLALAMREAKFDVIGVDVDAAAVDALADGHSTVEDITDARLTEALEQGFHVAAEYDPLAQADAVSICVPAPLRKSGQPDLSFVVAAADTLAGVVTAQTTVILESTVYPGATEEVVGARLSAEGWTVGEDLHVAFSPERIDPGNTQYGPTEIPKVVGGVTLVCGDRAVAVYDQVFETVVKVGSAAEVEVASSVVVVFIDDDAVADEMWTERLVRAQNGKT